MSLELGHRAVLRTTRLFNQIKCDAIDARLASQLGYDLVQSEQLVELLPRTSTIDHFIQRKGEALPVIIQIPHALNEHSLMAIGTYLFKYLNARGLWSSLVKRSVFDAAHEVKGQLTAATVGASHAEPELVFISIHGFVPTDENELEDAAMVVSSGTWWPSARALDLNKALKRAFKPPKAIHLFPWHTEYLGGTTNIQGRVLRSLRRDENFLHIELSSACRRAFVANQESLRVFAETIKTAVTRRPTRAALGYSDPWEISIGAKARANISGLQLVAAALNLTEDELHERYGKPLKRRQIAADLGVAVHEVTHYLDRIDA